MQSDELANIFKKYGYFVQRRCVQLLGHTADAEDVTQEVFMRLQRYSSSLNAPVTLSYLYAIAARCCFDRSQQRQRQRPLGPDDLENVMVPEGASPDERALVGQLMRTLDKTTSEIAILHHIEGWTQDEIAAQTGYSRKTIGKKLSLFADAFKAAWLRMAPLRREVGS